MKTDIKEDKTAFRYFLYTILILLLLAIIGNSTCIREEKEPMGKTPLTAEQIRNEKIRKLFNSYDGSIFEVNYYIKTNMHNPDSFKHVKTSYWDKKDYLLVKVTFRGTNIFGGVIANDVLAKVDIDGNVLEIIAYNIN